jgi:hypothetical protein
MDKLPALIDPHVSIVVVNHNYARFLDRAIASAVDQTRACQVVVVDDGSTDDSPAVLARWAGRARIERRANGGQRAAYNAGFGCCSGDVVIFLDSDDYLMPDAAARVARAFAEDVAKVHFRLRLIDAEGRALGGDVPSVLAAGDAAQPLLRSGLLYTSAPGSGNAYRRSVLERLFPLPLAVEDPVGADFFTIYGAALFGRIHALDETLGAYRVHTAGAQGSAGYVLGNAAQQEAELARVALRRRQFRGWIAERTGGALRVPERLTDFSEAKGLFVRALTERRNVARLAGGARALPALLRTLWLQSERPLKLKAVLSVWGMSTLLLPRLVADPLVRYVANPASRRPLRGPFMDTLSRRLLRRRKR